MIHVIAIVELHLGRRDDFLAEFQKIVAAVRAEEGCIEYGPAVDVVSGIEAQGPVRDDVVTVVEKWESVEHLKRHLVAPHMLDYRPRVKDMVVKTSMAILKPASTP